ALGLLPMERVALPLLVAAAVELVRRAVLFVDDLAVHAKVGAVARTRVATHGERELRAALVPVAGEVELHPLGVVVRVRGPDERVEGLVATGRQLVELPVAELIDRHPVARDRRGAGRQRERER